MSSSNSSGKSRDGEQRSKKKAKGPNGQPPVNGVYLHDNPTFELPRAISQEEFVSLESDLAPLLDKITTMQKNFLANVGNWDDLVEDFSTALQSRIHVVKGAKDTLGRDKEQSAKIIVLDNLNKQLLLRYADIEGKFETQKGDLEHKIDILQSDKEALEQTLKEKYKREYTDRTNEVEKKRKQMDEAHEKDKKRHELEKLEFKKKNRNGQEKGNR